MSELEPDPDQTPRKAGRPRSAQSHQAILGATLELFAEEGFQGLSIEAVAERAGVGKTTIYRRWSSKEDLIKDAVNMLRIDTDIQDSGNFRNDMLYMMKLTEEIRRRTPLLEKLLAKVIAEVKTNPEFYQFFYENLIAARMEQFMGIIKRAQDRGELRSDVDALLIINLVAGSALHNMLFADLLYPTTPITYKPEDVIDALLHGVGTASESIPHPNTALH